MSLDAQRSQLWHALGLGPLWRERALDAAAGQAAAPAAPDAADVGALGWEALEERVAACTACGLCRTRKQAVFAAGSQDAHWMFIGEAPGAEEDARGEPFVGQAGKLLDNMLAALGLSRDPGSVAEGAAPAPAASPVEPVYIANIVKCRPPGNRNPEPGEIAACRPYLMRQIELLRPRIIVAMGRIAVQGLLGSEASIASLRGRVHEFVLGELRVPLVVTYHPAYLLRTLADKAKSWDDLCLARATYERQGAAAG